LYFSGRTIKTIFQYQLITIHGFDAFTQIYAEEKGWVKTERKNTLNFAFMSSIN